MKTLQTTADDKEQLLEKQQQNVALATTKFEAAKRNLDVKSSVLETLRKLLSAANRAYKNAFNAAKLMQTRKRYAIEDEKQALIDNNVFLKAHREDGHTFIENMRDRFEYIDWESVKCTKKRIIWPHIDGILCIFFGIPIFLSQEEINKLLGYRPGNHHVTGALDQMIENKLINDKRNSIGTPVYYLGDFALQLLKRNPPNVDSRPEVYANSLATSLERGQAKINKNNSDSPATKPPTVTPLNNRKRKSSTSDKTSKGDTSSEEKDYDAASSDSDSKKAEKKHQVKVHPQPEL